MFTNKLKLKLLGYKCTFVFIQVVAVFLYLSINTNIPDPKSQIFLSQVPFDPISFVINLVIMMAVSYGVSALTRPKTKRAQAPTPAGLSAFTVPTAEEGRPMQVLFGKRYISGPNVLWYGNLKTLPVEKRY